MQQGFGPGNDWGQVFAQVPKHVPLAFSADRSGGVATPTMNVRGLSRRFGIVGGPAGTSDPGETWKKDLEALLNTDHPDNFSDPPSVNVTPEGVRLGYSLGLPSVACGMFLDEIDEWVDHANASWEEAG